MIFLKSVISIYKAYTLINYIELYSPTLNSLNTSKFETLNTLNSIVFLVSFIEMKIGSTTYKKSLHYTESI